MSHMKNTQQALSREREGPRIVREKKTVQHMIAIYCRSRHRLRVQEAYGVQAAEGASASASPTSASDPTVPSTRLCRECEDLLTYALKRLTYCRFGENKTTCAACPVHCYAPEPREDIKKVMRFAGPRMLWTHPVLTVRHLLDGRSRV
ncbi:nitrous oxide-stimulated promoter family protein [Paenibacillus sanfengchensis]|uniref:nitrous oxide-stimulated promoter family protein n=1 Tax=Paenibacillus sanfengchensis TaxID=3119819 RepID=UPI002FE2AB28